MEIQSIKLDFIGKLHVNLLEIGRRVNTLTIALPVLSLLLIGVALGVLPVADDVELTAFTVKAAYPVVLLAGCTALALAHMHFTALVDREAEVRDAIIRLYRELGFEDPSLAELEASPLEFPNVVTTTINSAHAARSKVAELLWFLWGAFTILVIFGSPLAACGVSAWQLVLKYGWQWWNTAPLAVPIVALVSNGLLVIRVFSSED